MLVCLVYISYDYRAEEEQQEENSDGWRSEMEDEVNEEYEDDGAFGL